MNNLILFFFGTAKRYFTTLFGLAFMLVVILSQVCDTSTELFLLSISIAFVSILVVLGIDKFVSVIWSKKRNS